MDSKNTKDGRDREISIAQIFGQMFSGSLVAGSLAGIPVVLMVALMWLAAFRPEESKLADDPTPDSFVSSEN